jgi:hypothetical protein
LVDLLVDTRAELMELAVASGLQVLTTMLEEDRTAMCGPRYQHQVERVATRAGTAASEVVLGGRKVAIRRPRVRQDGAEVSLPTFASGEYSVSASCITTRSPVTHVARPDDGDFA